MVPCSSTRVRAICDEMGATLIRSAYSANIKERRDCSTALFDPDGELVMQAEHIPVHLGSMPAAVAAVLGEEQRPGEWILNDPYRGGTHLPDITLISLSSPTGAARLRGQPRPSRRRGGPTPAAMPAYSTHDGGGGRGDSADRRPTEAALERLAAQMRLPRQRLADLRAQQAANRVGARAGRAGRAARRRGVRDGMAEILDYSERRSRAALAELADGTYEAEDVLEAAWTASERDLRLRLAATIEGEAMQARLQRQRRAGRGQPELPALGDQVGGLLRGPRPHRPDAPPSAGAHRPVEVLAPPGSLLNARFPAAVAAGNVETSSRVADLVLAALCQARPGPAQGQGTMNNLTLARTRSFTYYETIGGGQGACPDATGRARPRRDVEHPEHAGRGAGDRVPAAGARAVAAARQRRRRRQPRWRRDRARDRGAGADALLADHRASRHGPRGREGGDDGAPGRNCSTARRCRQGGRRLAPGDRLRSKLLAAADTATCHVTRHA